MVLQGSGAAAACQTFIGHSDSVTGLAWANEHTLISTGAGDAVLIWHLTPAALPVHAAAAADDDSPDTAVNKSLAHTVLAQTAGNPAAAMTEVFDSFHRGEPGLLQQSLEASSGGLNVQAQRLDGIQANMAADVLLPSSSVIPALSDTAPSTGWKEIQQSRPASAGKLTTDRQNLLMLDSQVLLMLEGQQQLVPAAVNGSPQASAAIVTEPHLAVERVVGFNGESQGTCAWLAETGVLVYAADHFLVMEQLATREQR